MIGISSRARRNDEPARPVIGRLEELTARLAEEADEAAPAEEATR